MSCGVGRRHGSDPMLLWLWRRPVATAPIPPQAWESPCAVGAVLKRHTHAHRLKKKKSDSLGVQKSSYTIYKVKNAREIVTFKG